MEGVQYFVEGRREEGRGLWGDPGRPCRPKGGVGWEAPPEAAAPALPWSLEPHLAQGLFSDSTRQAGKSPVSKRVGVEGGERQTAEQREVERGQRHAA